MRFFFAAQVAALPWPRSFIQGTQVLFDKAFARAFDGRLTRVEGGGNLVVRETIRSLEQDAGAGHCACRWVAPAKELEQLFHAAAEPG